MSMGIHSNLLTNILTGYLLWISQVRQLKTVVTDTKDHGQQIQNSNK